MKIISKLEFQSNVFDDVHSKFVSAHCIVTLNVLTVTDEIHKRSIFPIFRGLMEKSPLSWLLHLSRRNLDVTPAVTPSLGFCGLVAAMFEALYEKQGVRRYFSF